MLCYIVTPARAHTYANAHALTHPDPESIQTHRIFAIGFHFHVHLFPFLHILRHSLFEFGEGM